MKRKHSIIKRPLTTQGWANVGVCNRWTAVYLGRGWVLTAAHVGVSNITLEGTKYAADIKSQKRVLNPDETETDLMLFRIDPVPDLPPVELSAETPIIGSEIILVGSGLGRGRKDDRTRPCRLLVAKASSQALGYEYGV